MAIRAIHSHARKVHTKKGVRRVFVKFHLRKTKPKKRR